MQHIWVNSRRTPVLDTYYHTCWYHNPFYISYIYSELITIPIGKEWTGDRNTIFPKNKKVRELQRTELHLLYPPFLAVELEQHFKLSAIIEYPLFAQTYKPQFSDIQYLRKKEPWAKIKAERRHNTVRIFKNSRLSGDDLGITAIRPTFLHTLL